MCEEDKDTLLAAWEDEVIEQRKKELEVSVVDIALVVFTHISPVF